MALDDEPTKLTEKMREEIIEEKPIHDMLKPEGIISPANVERDYQKAAPPPEEEKSNIKTASAEERNRALERVRKKEQCAKDCKVYVAIQATH
jgi:hypothetical protein